MHTQHSTTHPGISKSTRVLTATALAVAIATAVSVMPLNRDALAATAPVPAISATPESFADLAERVSPAVVNIAATRHSVPSGNAARPPASDYEQFLRRFFPNLPNGPQRPHGPSQGQAVGSGFLIDAAGIVVTNHHVIAGADEISVTIHDGRQFPAKLIGADEQTDIAVLEIDSETPLPYVSFGQSATTRVGDWVVAVGNPFGLGGTVTAGIVSARGRDIQSGPYDDFLQFDAPINQGNSGGPLFDRRGEVIGVNSAIFSPSGGNVGIGFAIPAEIAKNVVAELREQGHVNRGWLGVHIQSLDNEIAAALGRDSTDGVLVAKVVPGGPAEQAGLRAGDVILDYAGESLAQVRDLPRLVASTKAGSPTGMTVWRDGKAETLTVSIGEQPLELAASSDIQADIQAQSTTVPARLGMALGELDDQNRRELGLNSDVEGVLVTDIQPGGPAASRGVRRGDVIVMVNMQRVSVPEEVTKVVAKAVSQHSDNVVLLVHRQGQDRFLAVPIRKA